MKYIMQKPYPDEDECTIYCVLDDYVGCRWEESTATFEDAKILAIKYYKEKIHEKFELIRKMRNLKEKDDDLAGD